VGVENLIGSSLIASIAALEALRQSNCLAAGATSAPEGAIAAAFMVRLKPYPSRSWRF